MKEVSKIVFQIDGGIGKSIAATAVCKAIKKQYPAAKLLVITGYPDVFLCNPHVDKVFNFNDLQYFYQDQIEGDKKLKLFLHNPYTETDFILQKGHLIKVWCEMFGIKYNGELPELFINNRERSFYLNRFSSQKPIMLLQTNGGAANQAAKYSWTRDLPMQTAQQIVNILKTTTTYSTSGAKTSWHSKTQRLYRQSSGHWQYLFRLVQSVYL